MASFILYPANERGHANHGWLDTYHTFSFASYYDESKMGFGALCVLNDDVIKPLKGFGTHSHSNMEIVSIPLYGRLEHRDSEGNVQTIESGEVQVMSAGTGIYHSEYNPSDVDNVNFLQIWIFPKNENVVPRYSKLSFGPSLGKNNFKLLVSPDKESLSTWINQDVWIYLADLDNDIKVRYLPNRKGMNGVFVFVIEGEIIVENNKLGKRDGIGLPGDEIIVLDAVLNSRILVIEVPLEV